MTRRVLVIILVIILTIYYLGSSIWVYRHYMNNVDVHDDAAYFIDKKTLYDSIGRKMERQLDELELQLGGTRPFVTRPFVAIVSCIKSPPRTNKGGGLQLDPADYLEHSLLASIYKTITQQERSHYRVEIILGYDDDDEYWKRSKNHQLLPRAHGEPLNVGEPIPISFVSIRRERFRPNRIPFNVLCQAAYDYGATYIARINDDIRFTTPGWITLATQTLRSFSPANIGVVGPVRKANDRFLVLDFVHAPSHYSIFDTYYPEQLDNLYVDDWMTNVYGAERTRKLSEWGVFHHSMVNMYIGTDIPGGMFDRLIKEGSARITKQIFHGDVVAGPKRKLFRVLGTERIEQVNGPMKELHLSLARVNNEVTHVNSQSKSLNHSIHKLQMPASTVLKEIAVSILNERNPCELFNQRPETMSSELQQRKILLQTVFSRLRSGEYEKEDSINHLCAAIKSGECSNVSPIEREWQHRMPGKTYIWTMDVHGGPVICDMPLILEAGGVFHAEILVPDKWCNFFGLCLDRLKGVSKPWDIEWFDPSEQMIKEFQLAYQDDPEFKRVDAFYCNVPAANCELFLPFNRSIIIHAATRLEFGRHDAGIDWRHQFGYTKEVGKQKWKKWIDTIQTLAKDERNVIAATNAYDRDYIKYFTGIDDVQLIPNWCGDSVGTKKFCDPNESMTNEWLPIRPEVIIAPYRGNLDRTRYEEKVRDSPMDHPIIKELAQVSKQMGGDITVKMIMELYSDSNPLHMLNHPAIIMLPYQVSLTHLIELYRLNIPAFCPSLSLLKKWCREHDLMWEVHYGWPENLMGVKDIPNPNGYPEMDKYSAEWDEMFDYWIPKSDFYQWNHITYFDSWEDFFQKYKSMLQNGELEKISHRMMKENTERRKDLVNRWRSVLDRIKRQ